MWSVPPLCKLPLSRLQNVTGGILWLLGLWQGLAKMNIYRREEGAFCRWCMNNQWKMLYHGVHLWYMSLTSMILTYTHSWYKHGLYLYKEHISSTFYTTYVLRKPTVETRIMQTDIWFPLWIWWLAGEFVHWFHDDNTNGNITSWCHKNPTGV